MLIELRQLLLKDNNVRPAVSDVKRNSNTLIEVVGLNGLLPEPNLLLALVECCGNEKGQRGRRRPMTTATLS